MPKGAIDPTFRDRLPHEDPIPIRNLEPSQFRETDRVGRAYGWTRSRCSDVGDPGRIHRTDHGLGSRFAELERAGSLLVSLMAFTFRDAHAWLGSMGISYHTVTKHKPRRRKSRDRRLDKF